MDKRPFPAIQPEDPAATVFRSEFSFVWHALHKLGAESSDLDDLSQEVFIRALRSLPKFDAERPLRPWLFAILFRTLQDSRKATARRAHAEVDVDLLHLPERTPEQDLERRDHRRLVLSALEAIKEKRRIVFAMVELDGCPVTEVAETLQLSLNTTYSRLRLARREFAAALNRLTAAPSPKSPPARRRPSPSE